MKGFWEITLHASVRGRYFVGKNAISSQSDPFCVQIPPPRCLRTIFARKMNGVQMFIIEFVTQKKSYPYGKPFSRYSHLLFKGVDRSKGVGLVDTMNKQNYESKIKHAKWMTSFLFGQNNILKILQFYTTSYKTKKKTNHIDIVMLS